MLFGISTKVLRDYPLDVAISIAADCGYRAIELWVDDIVHTSADKIVQLTDRLGLARTVHLLTEDLNIASFNEGIRKESMRQHKEGLKYAADVAAAATLHPGRKTAKTRTMDEAWICQINAVGELAQEARKWGVTLCLEGMERISGEFILSCEDLDRVIRECDACNLGVTLDIAHLHTVGSVDTLLDAAKKLPVENVHISQSCGTKPHLTLYDPRGEINYQSAIPILRTFYDKTLIVEGYIPNQGLEIARRSIGWYEQLMEENI